MNLVSDDDEEVANGVCISPSPPQISPLTPTDE